MNNSKYKEDFPERAREYASQGLIDKEIAAKLGVSHMTFYRYVKEHDDFREAVEEGKKPADVEVEQALWKRATGFKYEEITKIDGQPTKIVTKRALPETAAAIFWLKNRCRNGHRVWKDKFPEDVINDGPTEIVVKLPDDDMFNPREEIAEKIDNIRQRRENRPLDIQIKEATTALEELGARQAKEDNTNNGMADLEKQTKEPETRAAETSEDQEVNQETPDRATLGPISSLVKHPDDILD